jgi:hypothetical protein
MWHFSITLKGMKSKGVGVGEKVKSEGGGMLGDPGIFYSILWE